MLRSDHSDSSSRPGTTNTMFLFLRFQALQILRNLQGKMGHAWSLGLTGTSALLPNLPHIRGICGQLVRGPKIAIETVVKVIWRRSSRSVRPVEQVHEERRKEIKLKQTDALFILPADHSSYNE